MKKLFTAIFRRKPRPEPARKRPRRSMAMSLAALESRALLTMVGPVALTATSAVATIGTFARIAPEPQESPDWSLSASGSLDLVPGAGNPGNGGGGGGGGGWKNGGDLEMEPRPNGGSMAGMPFDPQKNHVAITVANISVGGATIPEFALADAAKNEVFIRIGNTIEPVLSATNGINDPQALSLAFLGDDPYPDLIVANSGGNNVLVFPGLAGGRFGPAIGGPGGFAVGQDPVSVTIADVNDDGVPDLLVANQGSNSISILGGQQDRSGNWTAESSRSLSDGEPTANIAPVKVLFADVNKDGLGDLIVLNKGADNVAVFNGTGDGVFDASDPEIYGVGKTPEDMVIGQFDKRGGLDLVTLNSGSNDLTFIDGILTAQPTIQTVSSGGIMPDAAFAFQPNPSTNTEMDLLVANGGDGRLALLQPGSTGMQIAGVIASSNLPVPTSLAAGNSDGMGFEFFAASAGSDAAELLRFDLGVGSTYLPTPLSESAAGNSGTEGELVAGLMPFGESALELIAVFWVGGPDQEAVSGEWNLREPSSITALYSPTEGQGADESSSTGETQADPTESREGSAEPARPEPPAVTNYVAGTTDRFLLASQPFEAIAARDVLPIDDDRIGERFISLDRRPFDPGIDPGVESISGAVAQALGLNWLDDSVAPGEDSPPTEVEPSTTPEGIDTPALEGQFETVPLISSVVLVSTRLILKASPPKAPSFRKKSGYRIGSDAPKAGPPA